MSESKFKFTKKKIFADASIVIAGLSSCGIFRVCLDKLHFDKPAYFCEDVSIAYPDKGNTIPESYVTGLGFFVPIFVIVLIEQFFKLKDKKATTSDNPTWLRFLYKYRVAYEWITSFIIGYITIGLSSASLKTMVRRLRPDFLDLCKPDFDCSLVKVKRFYVANYACTMGPEADGLNPSASFPSGHASFSTYCTLFVVMYLQRHLVISFCNLLKPIIQLLLLFIALYVSLTRITDNQHFWDDVLAGQILGITVCLIMVLTYTDFSKSYSSGTECRRD